MIRTKHALVFFAVLCVALLVVAVAILLRKAEEGRDTTVITDAVFINTEPKLGVVAETPKKDMRVRESLLQKLSGWVDPEGVTEENVTEEHTAQSEVEDKPTETFVPALTPQPTIADISTSTTPTSTAATTATSTVDKEATGSTSPEL